MSIDTEHNLTTVQFVKRLGVSARILEKWRGTGQGPPFLPVGRRVVYPVRWLVEWEEARKVITTAQAKWTRCNHSFAQGEKFSPP